MPRRSIMLSATLLLGLAASAQAGPPWISIELPANPHHASTRNASLLVRAYHHSTALNVPIRGVAEGIVDGRRVSLPLTMEATHQAGVFALVTPLPKGGTWVLALTLTESENATATALVTVDQGGRIVAVDVPSDNSRDGWKVPRRVQQRDIEAALRAAHVALGADPLDRERVSLLYALPLVLLCGATAAWGRRRRRM
jgi:hypothetical protein